MTSPWLAADHPRVAFVFRLPFALGLDPEALGVPVLLGGRRNAETLRVRIVRLEAPVLDDDAPARYLAQLRGERLTTQQPYMADAWLADVELDNYLEAERPGWSSGELLCEQALSALNRYLHAYMIASEDSSIRFLTAEALGAFAVVEFRLKDGAPLRSGSFVLPAAHARRQDQDARTLAARLSHAAEAERRGHPVDDVVLWRVRAEHLINYVGDYELSLLALQTSAEQLLYALARAIVVDKGGTAGDVDLVGRKAFDPLTKTLQHDLGGAWDKSRLDTPFGRYWEELYGVRNRIGHAGRRIDFHVAALAFDAYREFKEFVEERVITRVDALPRTALMLFGMQGLIERGAVTKAFKKFYESMNEDWAWWEPPPESRE